MNLLPTRCTITAVYPGWIYLCRRTYAHDGPCAMDAVKRKGLRAWWARRRGRTQ